VVYIINKTFKKDFGEKVFDKVLALELYSMELSPFLLMYLVKAMFLN
jgi:hypothetical protein